MKKYRTIFLLLIILLICSGCGLQTTSSTQENSVATKVAVTMMAKYVEMTVEASKNSTSDPVAAVQPTIPPQSTNTPLPTNTTTLPTNTSQPTQTPIPTNTVIVANVQDPNCNKATFIADVTIPDNTIILPNTAFTKTWRLKNIGTCTWTQNYKLVFSHGERMNAPAEANLPHVVAPGQTVDLSVNLVAPDSEASYRGDYKLKDEKGNVFALSNGATFYVQIESRAIAPHSHDQNNNQSNNNNNAPLPPASGLEVFYATEADSATYRGYLAKGTFILGDSFANVGFAAFIRFDLSNIPQGATVNDAIISFPSSFIVEGDPFTKLGCVRLFVGNYFPISPDDVAFPREGALSRACSIFELEYMNVDFNTINSFISSGQRDLQLLVIFNQAETDNDSVTDSLELVNQATNTTITIDYSY